MLPASHCADQAASARSPVRTSRHRRCLCTYKWCIPSPVDARWGWKATVSRTLASALINLEAALDDLEAAVLSAAAAFALSTY
jgi:hypothetical protein